MQKSTIYRKPMGENLFEEEFTIEALSQMGNPLDRLAALVDFEMFRPALEESIAEVLRWATVSERLSLAEQLPLEFMN